LPRREYYEKHKAELLEKQRLKRQAERERKEIEDPKPLREKFMSWEEYHEKYPNWDFKQYIQDKTEFEKPIPRPPRIDKDIRSRGYDFWHPTEEDKENRDERIAGRLLSDALGDDKPQPSQQPQETSKDDLNNILAEYDAKKKQREQTETDQNNEND
jgi:hypothetical protein